MLAFSGVVLVRMIPLWRAVPKGFLPSEDTGRLVINTEPAEGTSWDAMVRAHRQRGARSRPRTPPSSIANSSRRGSVSSAASCSCGSRTATAPHVDEVIQDLRRDLGAVPSLRAFP